MTRRPKTPRLRARMTIQVPTAVWASSHRRAARGAYLHCSSAEGTLWVDLGPPNFLVLRFYPAAGWDGTRGTMTSDVIGLMVALDSSISTEAMRHIDSWLRHELAAARRFASRLALSDVLPLPKRKKKEG